ncbi:MAG: hypothetical protein HFI75_07395 [Lachnospiraceae bacterium]|nr:hypothetical protein [Lachnospiraceae bacterium]
MAERVISIEVGIHITRLVEMDYKAKKPKIYSCFSFETPKGVLEDGVLRPSENFLGILKREIRHYRVKTNKVIFTVNSSRITEREVLVPLVKENRIAGMLTEQSSKYFPVDMSQYQLVYRIEEKISTRKKKNYRLYVLTVPQKLIKSYEELANACDLTIVAMDYAGNSVNQAAEKSMTEKGTMLLRIDTDTSGLLIRKNGRVKLQKDLPCGLGPAIEAFKKYDAYGNELSSAEVLRMMNQAVYINPHLSVGEEQDFSEQRAEITEALRKLMDGIKEIWEDYMIHNPKEEFRRIALIGSGAGCKGLDLLLSNELGIKVAPITGIPGITFSEGVDETDTLMAEYAVNIGAAMKPLHFQFGENKERYSVEQGSLALPAFIVVLCILASAACIGFCEYRMMSLEEEKSEYNNRMNELYAVRQDYHKYLEAEQELQLCQNISKLMKTPVNRSKDFFSEMEAEMPSDISIDSWKSDDKGITMEISVSSKESMADVLSRLGSLKTADTVSSGEITQSVDELGNVKVHAVITCTYAVWAAEE